MDKNMIFCNKIWRHFRKESPCTYNCCLFYFVCENARDMEQPILLPLKEFTEENLNEKGNV